MYVALVTRMEVPWFVPGLTEASSVELLKQLQENREIGGCLPLQKADEFPLAQLAYYVCMALCRAVLMVDSIEIPGGI